MLRATAFSNFFLLGTVRPVLKDLKWESLSSRFPSILFSFTIPLPSSVFLQWFSVVPPRLILIGSINGQRSPFRQIRVSLDFPLGQILFNTPV